MVAGFHVPVIPLLDSVGNAGAVAPTQSGPIAVNTGVICAAIVISIDAGLAHSPAAGVNVYVVVPAAAVLMVAGFQVPLIPLLDIAGNTGAVAPMQRLPIGSKVGVTGSVTVTSTVVVAVAHCTAPGGKVLGVAVD